MEFANEALDALALGSPEEEEEAGDGAQEEELDWEASPAEVARRIESVTLWLLDQLMQGQLPYFEIVRHPVSGGPRW